jgi:hypothetical protein
MFLERGFVFSFALMGYSAALVRQIGARAEAAHQRALAVVAPFPEGLHAPE